MKPLKVFQNSLFFSVIHLCVDSIFEPHIHTYKMSSNYFYQRFAPIYFLKSKSFQNQLNEQASTAFRKKVLTIGETPILVTAVT